MAWARHKVIIFKQNRGQTRITNNFYSTRTVKRDLNILRHAITSEILSFSPFCPILLVLEYSTSIYYKSEIILNGQVKFFRLGDFLLVL